jgi:tRNA 2-thiouridine synthesizing protein A
MAKHTLETKGLRCPQPVLKVAAMVPRLQEGDVLEVVGDCPTFEEDLRKWCTRMNKTLMAVTRDGDAVTVQIQL